MRDNLIRDKTFQFALKAINLYSILRNKGEFVISKQFLRCATSIGANVSEAEAAQSRKDFLSKISIASKEARETKYWLRLLSESSLVGINLLHYLNEIDDIINILTKIVKTLAKSINND